MDDVGGFAGAGGTERRVCAGESQDSEHLCVHVCGKREKGRSRNGGVCASWDIQRKRLSSLLKISAVVQHLAKPLL